MEIDTMALVAAAVMLAVILANVTGSAGKIDKLKRKIDDIERTFRTLDASKGVEDMSRIISELKGKKVELETYDDLFEGLVVDCDEEWIKIEETDKSGIVKHSIIRVRDIESVEIVTEKAE